MNVNMNTRPPLRAATTIGHEAASDVGPDVDTRRSRVRYAGSVGDPADSGGGMHLPCPECEREFPYEFEPSECDHCEPIGCQYGDSQTEEEDDPVEFFPMTVPLNQTVMMMHAERIIQACNRAGHPVSLRFATELATDLALHPGPGERDVRMALPGGERVAVPNTLAYKCIAQAKGRRRALPRLVEREVSQAKDRLRAFGWHIDAIKREAQMVRSGTYWVTRDQLRAFAERIRAIAEYVQPR